MVKYFTVSLGLFANAAEVSPVQKVLQLLDELKQKVQSDVDAERKQFEDNAAFCEDETKDKNYAIKTAKRRIEELQAAVEEADGNIQEHESTVSEVSTQVAKKERELEDAKTVRHEENRDFQNAEKELVDTIDTLARATAIIKKEMSFTQMSNGQQPKFSEKLGRLTFALSQIVDAAWVDSNSKEKLTGFLQSMSDDSLSLHQPQAKTSAYESHSDGIVTTLEDMKDKAEDALQGARKKEMKAQHSFALIEQSLADAIETLKDRQSDASSSKQDNVQAKGKASGELASTQKNKASDESYVNELTNDCKAKASEWEERQRTSSEEMAAIAKAAEILSSGVKAFVQVSSKNVKDVSELRQKATDLLKKLSRKYQSFALMQAAHMALSDPFVKVRGLIENMIAKLQEESNKDATHEAFCQEEMAKTTKSRENKTMRSDKFQARIDEATSTIAELTDSVRELQSQISSNHDAQKAATALRNEQHNAYTKASQDYSESAEAVARAVEVLKNYYQSGGAPGSARGDAGHSIIEILEVAESDFTRLLAESEAEEREAADAYDALTKKNKESNLAKKAEVQGKQSEVKTLEVALTHFREDHTTVNKELDAVMSYLDKLKPDCASKAMSYEERKARREAEIDGLQDALQILSADDGASLLETRHFLQRLSAHIQ